MSEPAEFTAGAFAAGHERVGATMTELVAAGVRSLEDGPVSSGATPAELLALFAGPLPDEGPEVEELLHVIRRAWSRTR